MHWLDYDSLDWEQEESCDRSSRKELGYLSVIVSYTITPPIYSITEPVFLLLGNPENDEKVIGDPFCVLFVSRLSYNLTEDDLMKEFDLYGPIKNVCRVEFHI